MYPAVKIEHEWADEDIGSNCGRRVYYDGERVEEYYPEYGKESLEFAASIIRACSFLFSEIFRFNITATKLKQKCNTGVLL